MGTGEERQNLENNLDPLAADHIQQGERSTCRMLGTAFKLGHVTHCHVKMMSKNSIRKGKKLFPGRGKDFNCVGSQLKPQFFFHPVPGYVFFIFWIG